MRIKKRLLALLAAGVVLIGNAGTASADQWKNTYTWPDKNVTVHVILQCNQSNPDYCFGVMSFEDAGPVDNVEKVELKLLQLIKIENGGGTSKVLRGSTQDGKSYFGIWWTVPTGHAACLHDAQYPNDITSGDVVWTRAEYRIHWNNGTVSAWQVHISPHVMFLSQSQCT